MHDAEVALRGLFGEPMDRRRFLKGSASGILLLSIGSLLPGGCRSYPKPVVSLRFFNAREYVTLNMVAERLLGVPGGVGAGTNRVDVAAHVDALVAEWDAEAQGQLRTMLRVFEHGTYLFDLRRKRFTQLSIPQKDRYMAGWMNSTLGARRIVFRALKALAASGFYQDAHSWPPIGYEGPWLGRIDASARLRPEPAAPLSTLLSGQK
jgi:hypothetical protein